MTLHPALQLQSGAALTAPLAPSVGPDLGWLFAMVAVFVVTIAGLALLFRKVVGGSLKARASKRDMHVLDVLPLGNKRQLAVVRCYDRTFALGLGERSVDLVAELDSQAIDHDQTQQAAGIEAPFMNRLEEAKSRLLGIQELAPQPAYGPDRGRRSSALVVRERSAGCPDRGRPVRRRDQGVHRMKWAASLLTVVLAMGAGALPALSASPAVSIAPATAQADLEDQSSVGPTELAPNESARSLARSRRRSRRSARRRVGSPLRWRSRSSSRSSASCPRS